MKCSKCGGNIQSFQYAVYYNDGSSSGYYRCDKCGAKKDWHISGTGEKVIDMSIPTSVTTRRDKKCK